MIHTTIREYVYAVRRSLAGVSSVDREEALAELESLLSADAERSSEAAAVAALGEPEEYAAQVRAALGPHGDADRDELEPQGRVLGMPYDFRGASVDRVSARMWNPSDPRVFTPRLFGLGWTINFGALAVRLGLIRPDDLGDDMFACVPRVVVNLVFAGPMVLATATLAVMALSWGSLPAEVPMHWGFSGAPDDFAPKGLALGLMFALTVLPVIVTAARLLSRRAGARDRVLAAAALALISSLGLGITVITVADADGGASGNYTLLVIVAGLALSFLLLYVPSRISLKAEWRQAARQSKGERP